MQGEEEGDGPRKTVYSTGGIHFCRPKRVFVEKDMCDGGDIQAMMDEEMIAPEVSRVITPIFCFSPVA